MLSVSGCVDIYGARGILGGKAPTAPAGYHERLKAQVSHMFDSNGTDPGSWTFSGSDSGVVKKGTRWLSIYIQVTILEYGVVDGISKLLGITLPRIDPYVHVQVRGADGSMQWDKTYNSSTQPPETITLLSPLDGLWSIHVDAVGFGFPKYASDSFKVMMSVNEPG
jgi:hypothetical protein